MTNTSISTGAPGTINQSNASLHGIEYLLSRISLLPFPHFKTRRKYKRDTGVVGQGETETTSSQRGHQGWKQEEEASGVPGRQHNADNEQEVSRACSDSDVSANDGTDAVDGGTLINGPVDVLSEDLGLEARKVDRPVAKDVSDSRDTRYTATVRCQPVDGRCRISSHYAVHSAAVHVREFHPRWWLRHEARPLHLVRGAATCNKRDRCIVIMSHEYPFDNRVSPLCLVTACLGSLSGRAWIFCTAFCC